MACVFIWFLFQAITFDVVKKFKKFFTEKNENININIQRLYIFVSIFTVIRLNSI